MYGAMNTQGRPCVYSSFIPRSLRTQMKQITSSRDNLDVKRVTQRRSAASLVFASKHTLREGTWHHSYFYFHYINSTEFYTGRLALRPEVHPLTFLYTIFHERGTPFVYLPWTNGTPFTYRV